MKYEKGEAVRWLSHLDVLRTFERALRRSGLPVEYTEGFNPRHKLWFCAPIGVGVTGEAELAAFDLAFSIDCEDIAQRLASVMPEGFKVRDAWPVDQKGSPFSNSVINSMRIALELSAGVTAGELQSAIDLSMARTEIEIERDSRGSTKTINIRPRIARLEIAETKESVAIVVADLIQTNEFGVRPAELVRALQKIAPGVELLSAHRVEVRIIRDTRTAKKGGEIVCQKRSS